MKFRWHKFRLFSSEKFLELGLEQHKLGSDVVAKCKDSLDREIQEPVSSIASRYFVVSKI